MLDKSKLIKLLSSELPIFFKNTEEEIEFSYKAFKWLQSKPDIAIAISQLNSDYLMPKFKGQINDKFNLVPYKESYHVLAVDGSQIYPDRHQGFTCFLLNIAISYFFYDTSSKDSKVEFESLPFVYSDMQDGNILCPELINCIRTELEFKIGLDYCIKKKSNEPFLFLCDGSLIFWHLENKDSETKKKFLNSYISLFEKFYEHRIPIAGFISLPKSREIVNILKTGLQYKIIPYNSSILFDHVVDSDICNFFLEPFTRSTIFSNHFPIVDSYPEHLRPYFVYLNIGTEIARLEFPYWIVQDNNLFNLIVEIVVDQCLKGQSYPISLSEAHEQAVIDNIDKMFFYHTISKMALNTNKRYSISAKSLNKKIVGV